MCAETVSRVAILRADVCPHCEAPLSFDGHDAMQELQTHQLKWRLLGYVLVGVTSFFAGMVPLLQVAVQLAAILILHVVVLRRGLLWLAPTRRVLARLAIKLLGAVVAAVALLINVAVAPLLGLSGILLAVAGLLCTALYVEGGLVILRQRLRWESQGRSLSPVEWGLPVGLLLTVLIAVGTTAALVLGTIHIIASAEIPTISEIATQLLEVWQ